MILSEEGKTCKKSIETLIDDTYKRIRERDNKGNPAENSLKRRKEEINNTLAIIENDEW